MLLCAALQLCAALHAQTTFRVPVRLVTAPALVFSSDGRLVSGLKAADFRLYDNGRLQKISAEPATAPISVAVAVQANADVRLYLPFIARVGSTIESLLVGEAGESALIAYHTEIATLKPFASGDFQKALRTLAIGGPRARSIDAGMRAIAMLRERPPSQSRVLLLIGQPMDDGSESKLDALQEAAEQANVMVCALALPEVGKAFVSDNFTLRGPEEGEHGGFKAGVDLLKLVTVLERADASAAGGDPFHALAAATAGSVFRFRKQNELEGALAAIGVQLRSGYLLSYYVNGEEPGRHTIRVEVDVPGAKVRT